MKKTNIETLQLQDFFSNECPLLSLFPEILVFLHHETNQPMRLDKLLVARGLFPSRERALDSLSEADQKLIRETILEAADYGTKITEEGEAKCRATMEAGGMEFIEVDASKFKEAAMASLEKVAADWEAWVLPQALKDMGL